MAESSNSDPLEDKLVNLSERLVIADEDSVDKSEHEHEDSGANSTSRLAELRDYQYPPLEHPDEQFRLLLLIRIVDTGYGDLLLALLPVRPDHTPDFIAISYTWGGQIPSRRLLCNDVGRAPHGGLQLSTEETVITVTETVYKLLREVQPSMNYQGYGAIWVDAVCINQNDMDERSKQVKLMRSIYRAAYLTMIWFPPSDSIADIDKTHEAIERLAYPARKRNCEMQPDFDWSSFGLRSEGELTLTPAHAHALASFLANPWFTRTWTLQEFILAQRVAFRYGHRKLSWNMLLLACQEAGNFGHIEGMQSVVDNNVALLHMSNHRHRFLRLMQASCSCGEAIYDQPITQELRYLRNALWLPVLLSQTRDRQATDPRDKYYGILCIAAVNYAANVDYSKTVRDVYIRAALHCMSATQATCHKCDDDENGFRHRLFELQFLHDAGWIPDEERRTSKAFHPGEYWPSWLPDWSQKKADGMIRHKVMSGLSASGPHQSFAAVFEKHEQHTTEPKRGPCLRTRGVRVLTIDHVLDDLSDNDYASYTDAILHAKEPYPPQTPGSYSYMDALLSAINPRKHDEEHPWPPNKGVALNSGFWSYISQGTPALANTLPPKAPEKHEYSACRSCPGGEKQGIRVSNPCEPKDIDKWLDATAAGSKQPFPRIRLEGGYKLCITTFGFLGQIPKETRRGDEVAVLFGAQTPFVIRRDGDHYLLIGDCFINGLAEGQAMCDLDQAKIESLWLW